MRTDECARFGDSLEEANCHDIPWVFGCGGDHGESSPENHHAWEEDTGFEVIEGEVAGDLANNVSVDIINLIPTNGTRSRKKNNG